MIFEKAEHKDIVFTQNEEYFVSSVVCDHGIWEKDSEHGDREVDGQKYSLKLILNSRANCIGILKILDADTRHEVYDRNFLKPF